MTYEEMLAAGAKDAGAGPEQEAPTYDELVAQGAEKFDPKPGFDYGMTLAPKKEEPKHSAVESALMGAQSTLTGGLVRRLKAADQAVGSSVGLNTFNPLDKIKNVGKAISSPGETYKKFKSDYDKNFQEVNQDYDQAIEEHPISSFLGAAGSAMLTAPKSVGQAALIGLGNALGGTEAEYDKAASGDLKHIETAGRDAALGMGLGAAGYKFPTATAAASLGAGIWGDKLGMSPGAQSQALLSGALGVGARAAKSLGGAATSTRRKALDNIRSGVEEKFAADDAKFNAYAEKNRRDIIEGKNKALNNMDRQVADREAAQLKALNTQAKDKYGADVKAYRADQAQRRTEKGQLSDLVDSQRQYDELAAKADSGQVGPSKQDLLAKKANDFEASIDKRVQSKEAAEFGALMNRIATLKMLGEEIPPELNVAKERYLKNSPNLVKEMLAKDPAALSQQYRQELVDELAMMRADAANGPSARGAPAKEVNYRNLNDVFKDAGMYEAAQKFPEFAKTNTEPIAPLPKPERPAPITSLDQAPPPASEPTVSPEQMARSAVDTNPGRAPREAKPAQAPPPAAEVEESTNPGVKPQNLDQDISHRFSPEVAEVMKAAAAKGKKASPLDLYAADHNLNGASDDINTVSGKAKPDYSNMSPDQRRMMEKAAQLEADLEARGVKPEPAENIAPGYRSRPQQIEDAIQAKMDAAKFGPALKQSFMKDNKIASAMGLAGLGNDLIRSGGGFKNALMMATAGKLLSATASVASDPALRAKMMGGVQNLLRYNPEFAQQYGSRLGSAMARGEMDAIAGALQLAGQDEKFKKALEQELAQGSPPSPNAPAQ